MSRHLLPEIWPLRYNMHLNEKENWSSFKVFFQCQVVLFKIQFLNLLNQNKRVMWKIKWKLAHWSNGVQTPIDCYHNLTVCILSVYINKKISYIVLSLCSSYSWCLTAKPNWLKHQLLICKPWVQNQVGFDIVFLYKKFKNPLYGKELYNLKI